MLVLLSILGIIALLLAYSAFQRKFFPQSLINGYMSMEMLEAICPEIYKNIFGKKNGKKAKKEEE